MPLLTRAAVIFLLSSLLLCGADATFDGLLSAFSWRNLGPFRAGAWIVDVAVPETPRNAHLYTLYAAARTGGVWKTVNNGATFELVFKQQPSIGAIALAPSNSDIVWVGTGDNTATRSGYWGDGVYKSTDGGKTWANMGLQDSHHISRIVVHPSNPEIVYVAALGHLYTPNQERGVFKTTDGGRTWKRLLFSGDLTGAVDLVLDRRNPDTLYAAMYEHRRFPWRLIDGGPNSGIHKTTDGGATWQKLANGLPGGTIGRIGLDICRSNPAVLYAVVDNFNAKADGQGPIGGEVYRTQDGGGSWVKMNAASDDVSRKAGYSFNQIRVDPNHPNRIFVTGSSLIRSDDGGKTWSGLGQGAGAFNQERSFRRAFGDFRSLWIDPENSDRMIAASDGGVFLSYDGGRTCDHLANLPLGEVYAVGVDMASPYNIYAGLQDHESWKGPSNGPSGSIGVEDWSTVGTGDGMYNEPDPNGRWLYNTQEFGRHQRVDLRERTRKLIAPVRPQGQPPLRWNWTAPLRISPHNSAILYAGSQVLHRSTDRGDTWQEISPDLTTNDPEKITRPGGSIQHCTIVTISESPAVAGVIWVGTDDGKVQVTRDGGGKWFDATARLAAAGGPADAWVTRVFASPFQGGTAYVTKNRRRQDDFRPYLFRTTDYGETWTNLSSGLSGSLGLNTVVEDPVNAAVVYVGADNGVYASFDRGVSWTALNLNMPPVPVHDLLIHPREHDLVAGTYGRGVWVINVTAFREFSKDLLTKDSHLFGVKPFAQRKEGVWGNYRLYGDQVLATPNEPNAMVLHYYLKQAVDKPVLTISTGSGEVVRTLPLNPKPGLNRALWDLDDSRGNPAPAGEYIVTLQTGTSKQVQKAVLISRAPEDTPRPRQFRLPR